jgi:NAD(P)-binding Rossmann-like domain
MPPPVFHGVKITRIAAATGSGVLLSSALPGPLGRGPGRLPAERPPPVACPWAAADRMQRAYPQRRARNEARANAMRGEDAEDYARPRGGVAVTEPEDPARGKQQEGDKQLRSGGYTCSVTPPRAVVIGAGHNGLLCAGTLAEAGWHVTVIEHSSHAGGAVHSCEGPLPGFVIDPCAGYFPLTRASPAFDGIDLDQLGVEWVEAPVVMVHPLLDGRSIALHRELEPTVASLEAVCPALDRLGLS